MSDSRQPPGMMPQRPQPVVPHAPHAPHVGGPHVVPHPPQAHPARPSVAPMPIQTARPTADDLDPIALVEEPAEDLAAASTAVATKSKIKAFGANETARRDRQWKRTPFKDGKGACRVKTFHAKYSDQGMEHLDDMINEWLDEHPDVEVKFVTSTVNVFEGKIREPALVLNLWY